MNIPSLKRMAETKLAYLEDQCRGGIPVDVHAEQRAIYSAFLKMAAVVDAARTVNQFRGAKYLDNLCLALATFDDAQLGDAEEGTHEQA